ncbi:hypothetical protein [Allopontixanthobacter sediminis]|uniref:Lipoprotein n=1 Tax=Allopontixanthobacter sediminis TaxID=1689985 RepID=A0A845B1P0_9SPHN|nr:hypothetical protein [Allopontixanthobacter sediminis]MXP44188.1 hypothetical protein [Allopontixanthobacter sediminis]
MNRIYAPLGVLALALAACAPDPSPEPTDPATSAAGPEIPEGTFLLSPLSAAEIEAANLPQELGCAFETGDDILLAAKAYVGENQRGLGVMKINGFTEAVQTPHTGGFGTMSDRGEFEGRGLTVDVEPSGDNLAEMEGSRYDAQMTVTRVGADDQVIDGIWSCGP